MTVVVGAPITVEKTSEPSIEQIDELQSKYIEALVSLYNEYNPVYGDKNVVLEIGNWGESRAWVLGDDIFAELINCNWCQQMNAQNLSLDPDHNNAKISDEKSFK